jgi:DNA-binding transcriptional LysR family regulator
VTVTPAGEFVIARARQLVFNSRCLERDVALYRDRGLGDIAFGVGPFPAGTFLPQLLADLRREHPDVHLRVEISNWELLVKRLLEEDIEFFVADARDLPANPLLHVAPLREEPGGFYVRRGHPLARRRSVPIRELWQHGVVTVRLPRSVQALLSRLLGAEPGASLPLALECDNLHVLRTVAMQSESVLAAPHAAVAGEVAAGALKRLVVPELPVVAAQMGVVTLRGRTPSPMAELILGRLAA